MSESVCVCVVPTQLNCWGQVRYKLQVQGTKEVYERTKKLMKETEEQKQKTR